MSDHQRVQKFVEANSAPDLAWETKTSQDFINRDHETCIAIDCCGWQEVDCCI